MQPDPKVALVVITDGRGEYLEQAIDSAEENLKGAFDPILLVNDSGDPAYAGWLDDRFPFIEKIHHAERRGLAGAVRSAWTRALECDTDFVFHLEDDFTFNEPIAIEQLIDILSRSRLAQVSLKRQAVNRLEIEAGGFMQCNLDAYADRVGYVEQQLLFTFNPCLIPRLIMKWCLESPGDGLERGFTDTLIAKGFSFAVFGSIADSPRVSHIGKLRSPGWKV